MRSCRNNGEVACEQRIVFSRLPVVFKKLQKPHEWLVAFVSRNSEKLPPSLDQVRRNSKFCRKVLMQFRGSKLLLALHGFSAD